MLRKLTARNAQLQPDLLDDRVTVLNHENEAIGSYKIPESAMTLVTLRDGTEVPIVGGETEAVEFIVRKYNQSSE